MIIHNPCTVDRAMILTRGLEMELYGAVSMDRGRHKSGLCLCQEQKTFSGLGWASQAQFSDTVVKLTHRRLGVLKR